MGHKLDRVPAWLKKQRIGGTWLVLTHLCKISHQKLYRLCTGRRPPCRLVLDPPDSKLFLIWAIGFLRLFWWFRSQIIFSILVAPAKLSLCGWDRCSYVRWELPSSQPSRRLIVRPKINEILDGNWEKLRGNINLHPGLIHQISTCFKICGVSQVVLSASVRSEYNSWKGFAF